MNASSTPTNSDASTVSQPAGHGGQVLCSNEDELGAPVTSENDLYVLSGVNQDFINNVRAQNVTQQPCNIQAMSQIKPTPPTTSNKTVPTLMCANVRAAFSKFDSLATEIIEENIDIAFLS